MEDRCVLNLPLGAQAVLTDSPDVSGHVRIVAQSGAFTSPPHDPLQHFFFFFQRGGVGGGGHFEMQQGQIREAGMQLPE